MPREILRAKLYELIQNIEEESTLIELSNILNRLTQNEAAINFEADNLDEFMHDNIDILVEDKKL
jgi:hypothetical protein